MKKKLLTLILLLVTVFGVFAVGNLKNVEAYDVTANVYIYFQKPDSWDKACTQLMIGHNTWSQGYQMTRLGNTDIYYVKMPSWGGYYDLAFFNTDTQWGGEGSKISNRQAWAPHYTNMINPGKNITNSWFFISNSNSDTVTKFSNSAYTTMNVKVTASASAGGSVSAKGDKLTAQNAVTAQTGPSIDVVQYTDVVLSATPAAGYKFVGWYSDSAYKTLVSSNASYTVKDVTAATTYYAKFEPSVSLAEMFSQYYNNGSYTKETVININTANEDLELELIQHFHAATNSLDRVQTNKTTYYNGDILWFAEGHGYGKSEDNKLTSIRVENNDPTTVKVTSTTNLPGMEDYYCTLKDFVEGTHNSKHSNNETLDLLSGWTYENGVYKNSSSAAIDAFILFTAPTWLDTDTGNYLEYDHVTVQVVGNQLVMKLWVSATAMPVNSEGGKLVVDAEVSGDYAVFSQATISKGIVA